MMQISPEIRIANSNDSLKDVMTLINDAYRVGEAGIMIDSWTRVLEEDVQTLLDSRRLYLLILNKNIIGCYKINTDIEQDADGKVGEWGCLAVHSDYHSKGYGSLLQTSAEQTLRDIGCEVAQLELLTPTNWVQPHKERLRKWYIKLGYSLKVENDYASSTVKVPSGEKLMGRDNLTLATDGDFTVYRKRIDLVDYYVTQPKINYFRENGFVVLENVVSSREVARYLAILKKMVHGEISTKDKRGDLGGHTERVDQMVENIIQIVHPDVLTSKLDACEHFRKGEDIAEQLYARENSGKKENWGLDCAQMIVKMAKTDTETPWHQDQSYYPDLIDKRACNIWLALEDCTVESGCMRFLPTPINYTKLSPHRAAGNGRGALTTDPPNGTESQICTPLRAGSVVVFNNYTYHYGGPNTSNNWRPAFVGQYRPKKMIQACRELGFDHGKFASNEDGSERTSRAVKEEQKEERKDK
jgi:phytanoyl-CoA hydroxylase